MGKGAMVLTKGVGAETTCLTIGAGAATTCLTVQREAGGNVAGVRLLLPVSASFREGGIE